MFVYKSKQEVLYIGRRYWYIGKRYCIFVSLFLYKPSNWLHQVKVELNCAESISSIDFFILFDRLLNRKHKRLQSHVLVLALNAPIAND